MIDSNNMQITLAYNLIDISHEQLILMNVSIKENKYKCAYIWNMHESCVTYDLLSDGKKCLFAKREFMRNSVVC